MKEFFINAFDITAIEHIMAVPLGQNTVGSYTIALVLFALIWAVIRAFRLVGLSRLRNWATKTPGKFDDNILKWAAQISPLFFAYLSAVIVIGVYLVLPANIERAIDHGFVLLFIYEAMRVLQKIVNFGLSQTPLKKNTTTLHGTQRIMGIIIWSVGLLMALSNLGVNVTTLVASLGITGIAIAFAIQHILGDIFSSFSIYFDKPFQEGDYIVVDDEGGEIQQIGLKTTRILGLGGEEIVMSNKALTESRIHNYGKLERRRVTFDLSVAFDTPLKKLEIIDDIVQEIVESQSKCEFDRVWFKKIASFSYDFEAVYYVASDDYMDYVNAQEKMNWRVIEEFEKAGIEFALPTSVKIAYKK